MYRTAIHLTQTGGAVVHVDGRVSNEVLAKLRTIPAV